MLSRTSALPTAFTITVEGMSTWKVYLLQFLPRSASERAPICMNRRLLRSATGLVDFLLRHANAELGIGAERAEKAGQRRQVADLYLLGLAVDDRRKSERRRAGKGGAGFQQGSSAGAGHRWSP